MAENMPVKNESSDPVPGMASLVGGIIEDTQRLVRQEVALARSEAQEAWDKAKMSAALLAAALTVCMPSGVLLGLMLVRLLEQVLPYEWACFGIVGCSFAILGGLLIYGGADPVPPGSAGAAPDDRNPPAGRPGGNNGVDARRTALSWHTYSHRPVAKEFIVDETQVATEPTQEEMRQEIDETRSALTDKLEALEGQVMNTVARPGRRSRSRSSPPGTPWRRPFRASRRRYEKR